MKKIPLLTAFFVFILAGGLFAASAVYFCQITGAIGVTYNSDTVENAKIGAFQTCLNYGGKSPILNNSSSYGGIGVVMWAEDSSNRRWCSSVLSASSDQQAMQMASDALTSVGAIYNMSYNKFVDTIIQ